MSQRDAYGTGGGIFLSSGKEVPKGFLCPIGTPMEEQTLRAYPMQLYPQGPFTKYSNHRLSFAKSKTNKIKVPKGCLWHRLQRSGLLLLYFFRCWI